MNTLNLGDICEAVTKGTTPTTLGMKLNEGNVNFIKVECLSEDGQIVWEKIQKIDETTHSKLKRSQLKVGDILFSIAGSIGRMAIVTEDLLPANTNQAVAILRPKVDLVDTDFLFYFLRDAKSQGDARKRIVQSVQNNLSLGELANLSISLPSRTTQVAISSFMRVLDNKISLNRSISKTLENIAQTIFKSWFIDFDPVKAKIAGEKPVGMDDVTAALFPDSMEDSELGPVPTNWHPVPLTNFFEVLSGGTPKTTEASFWGGPIPWFSVVDAPVSGGCFFIKTEKTITEQGVSNSAAKIVRPGVTIISARGTVGKTAVVATPSTFNQSCYGLMGKYGDFYTYLLVKHMVTRLQNIAHGGMFDTITRETFSALTVPKPMEPVIDTFEKLVEPMFMQIKNLQYQSEQLATMRDALLPRLISGELQIPEEMLVS